MLVPPSKKPNPKAAMQASFLDKMAQPGAADPMAEPSPEDIDEETETETAAPEMDLTSIPDAMLEAELAKRKSAKAGGASGVMPPPQDELSIV
jgi:hypothetical protein